MSKPKPMRIRQKHKQLKNFKFYKKQCDCGCKTWIDYYLKEWPSKRRLYAIGHQIKGKKQPPERIKNWLKSMQGYKHSIKTKQKIAASMRGNKNAIKVGKERKLS